MNDSIGLPDEIVFHIMKFMGLQDKESFTNAFPRYYCEFIKRKRQFLEENFHLNYKPLVKKGIDYFIRENKLCIVAIMRKKKFFIDSFPEPFRRFFVDYDTPLIPYKCRFGFALNHHWSDDNKFNCKPEDLKNKISIGNYPPEFNVNKDCKFILIKTKLDTVISIWSMGYSANWNCHIDGETHFILGDYYISFSVIERILEQI